MSHKFIQYLQVNKLVARHMVVFPLLLLKILWLLIFLAEADVFNPVFEVEASICVLSLTLSTHAFFVGLAP